MSGLPVRGLGKAATRELCGYCGRRNATGRDHVFAKSFFPKYQRANLPQVPACSPCNGRKGALEAELSAVLPFGSRHKAAEQLFELIPGRLRKNNRLFNGLTLQPIAIQSEDNPFEVRLASTINFDWEQFNELFQWIVRGLYYHHWQLRLSPTYGVRTRVFGRNETPQLESYLEGTNVAAELGGGTFSYVGRKASDNPNASVWRFHMFGSMHMLDPNRGNEPLTEIFVTTLRKDFFDRLDAGDFDQGVERGSLAAENLK